MSFEPQKMRRALFAPIIHLFQSDIFKIILIIISVIAIYQICMNITAHALQGNTQYSQNYVTKGAGQSSIAVRSLQNAYFNPQDSAIGYNFLYSQD